MVFSIAFRNLFRQLRRSVFTALTIIIGFILLSLSMGISLGSYAQIIEMFTSNKTGHVQIHYGDYLEKASIYKTISPDILQRMEAIDYIHSSSPRVYFPALVFLHKKTSGAEIVGIDYSKEFKTTHLQKKLSQGTFSTKGIVISYGLAKILQGKIGDKIALISQGADGSISNELFPITGIIGTKKEDRFSTICYLNLATAQEFLALGNRVHEITIKTDSYQKAPQYAEKLRQELHNKELDVQPWQVVEKSFYEAMQADVEGMWISLGIIMLIVAIGVLNTILMSLLERTREYGIMQALGTAPFFLFRQILLEVFLLTTFSIFIGSIFAFIGNSLLATYGITLSHPISYGGMEFTEYKSIISWDTYIIPALLIWGTSLVISIFPAITTIVKKPVESIRHI